MKVLFVVSGNSQNFKIAPFIKSQADSLISQNNSFDYFLVKGKGILGYLKNILPLRKQIKNQNYDIIHSHYALTGWLSVLTFVKKPIVVSYMGCDTYGDFDARGKQTILGYFLILLGKTLQPFVKSIIVKSDNLAKYIYLKKKLNIIPNGVDLDKFTPMNKNETRIRLKLDRSIKYILFLGNLSDSRKNFELLVQSKQHCYYAFEILSPYPLEHDRITQYMNAADVLVVTSLQEGSPNVIKEAMACNLPVVSTNVGDVKLLFGSEPGHFLTSFDPNDVAEKIKSALEFSEKYGRTNGRKIILELGLDSQTVAKKIISVYKEVLNISA